MRFKNTSEYRIQRFCDQSGSGVIGRYLQAKSDQLCVIKTRFTESRVTWLRASGRPHSHDGLGFPIISEMLREASIGERVRLIYEDIPSFLRFDGPQIISVSAADRSVNIPDNYCSRQKREVR